MDRLTGFLAAVESLTGNLAEWEPYDFGFMMLKEQSLGSIITSSTSAVSTGKTLTVPGVDPYDMLLVVISAGEVATGRHVATVSGCILTAPYGLDERDRRGTVNLGAAMNLLAPSDGEVTMLANTTFYGIYPSSRSYSGGEVSMPLSARYNSTNTLAINNDYTAKVYGVRFADLIVAAAQEAAAE